MPIGWREFVGDAGRIVSLNHFGASAAYTVLYEQFGLTTDAVVAAARESRAAVQAPPAAPTDPDSAGVLHTLPPATADPPPLSHPPSTEGPVMAPNEKLTELSEAGVAVWLDDLSRDRIHSGGLQSLADDYSVVGVTTNPTIFAAAISASDSYDDQVHAMAVRKISVEEALRTITAADVRDACDLLAPVAQRTGRDGRVSLEVAPGLAHDTDATAAEAAHLWWLVDRPNLFIKIPATREGLAAITTSIAQGISVNVTLIFSLERYRAVMDAYLSGLEQRVQDGGSLTGIESVASFFISRVDTEIDRRLEKAGADPALKGKAALANAQLAYQAYEEVFSSGRWRALQAQGANTQRPLWASTGVKNQDYPDTLYVSNLIAPDTVNTMPEKTLMSYADHGRPGEPIQNTYDEAAQVMKAVTDAGVDLDDVFAVLEDEGIHKFAGSWDELTKSVRSELEDKKCATGPADGSGGG